MGDGTVWNPYTREDVLRLIKENGDKAEGLDLSGKVFERGLDLNGLNLRGILLRGANLELARLGDAHLEGAILRFANLKGAYLADAHLEGAVLFDADLEGAILQSAHLEGAYLGGARFSPETRLEQADWGNFILREEETQQFVIAATTYRRLKIWYTNAGIYDTAGEFFFREMEAKRKAQTWKKKPHLKLWHWIMRWLCGYGEKPERVVVSAIAVILAFTLIYFGFNSVQEWSALWKSLYFSAVSFTSLGYGGWIDDKWVDISNNWIKGIGVTESFCGAFLMALFLVTFTRKMTR